MPQSKATWMHSNPTFVQPKRNLFKKYGHYHIKTHPHSQHFQKQRIIWWYILRQNITRHAYSLFTIIIVIIRRNTRFLYKSQSSWLSINHGKIGTDQTCQLVVPSASGNNPLLILFDLDRNYIFSKKILNRNKYYIKNAYGNILNIHKNRGLKLQLHRLDN